MHFWYCFCNLVSVQGIKTNLFDIGQSGKVSRVCGCEGEQREDIAASEITKA